MHFGYLAVVLGVLVEGEIFLLSAGIAASTGVFDYKVLILVAVLSAMFHDNFLFLTSNTFGRKYLNNKPMLVEKVDRAFSIIERYNNIVILLVRFLYGFRIVTLLALGMGKFSRVRFFILDAISSVIWSFLYITLGYYFGDLILSFFDEHNLFEWIKHNRGLSALIVLLLSSFIYLVFKLSAKLRKS